MLFACLVEAVVRRDATLRAGRWWLARTWLIRVTSAGSTVSLGVIVAAAAGPASAKSAHTRVATVASLLGPKRQSRPVMYSYIDRLERRFVPRRSELQERCRVSDTGK